MTALAAAGIFVSWFAAGQVARSSAEHSRAHYRLAAEQVSSNMELEVQHEVDLLLAAAVFMQEHPRASAARFASWVTAVHALRRYPELLSITEIEPRVPGLPSEAWPRGSCPRVVVDGQPFVMRLASLGESEICKTGSTFAQTRDGGRLVDFGFAVAPGSSVYGEALPVFRTPTVPETRAGRRRELLGWIVVAVNPEVMLRRALADSPGLRVDLSTTLGNLVSFSAGPHLVGGTATRVRLSDGSTETIYGSVRGASIFQQSAAMAILFGSGTISALVALLVFLLATGRARAERLVRDKTSELSFQATHDHLTGLPNRLLVMDRIEQALRRAERDALPPALMFVDIDGFKAINDTFGHGTGDELLRAVASRLTGVIRDADTVGRFGGDEFLVLLEGGEQQPPAELVAQRILRALNQPITLERGAEVRLSASVGIAVKARGDAEQLLRDADVALYAAKAAGKNACVTYTDELQVTVAERQSLELDLRSAIANGELSLVYQPILNLDTETLRAVEALLRWQTPTWGDVPPARFIPIAEESGQIIAIGLWVAREACRQAAIWQRRGIQMVIGINVSGRQLDDPHFTRDITQVLRETGLEPASLVLEITETSLMRDPAAATARLNELKCLGVRIAIDDFGTGYSSLAYLRNFPVDAIKVDSGFVGSIGTSADADALVDTLLQLGRTLHLTTVGEGIETQRQLEHLRRAGCDFGQGFLFAQPLSVALFDQLVADGTLRTTQVSSQIPQWTEHMTGTRPRPAGRSSGERR